MNVQNAVDEAKGPFVWSCARLVVHFQLKRIHPCQSLTRFALASKTDSNAFPLPSANVIHLFVFPLSQEMFFVAARATSFYITDVPDTRIFKRRVEWIVGSKVNFRNIRASGCNIRESWKRT